MPPKAIWHQNTETCSFSDVEKYRNLYSCVSLTELVAIEITHLHAFKRKICHCKLCSRLFVPYSVTAQYCHNTNPDLGGKKCSEVARYLTLKKTVENDQLLKERQKNYRTYHQWVRRQMEQGYAAHIQEEIQKKFKKWKKDTSKAIDQYRREKLSQEEGLRQVAIPQIKDRSPLLEGRKKYLRG